MTGQDIAALVRPASPVLSSFLTGPSADLALRELGKALVDDDQASPDEIAAALKAGAPDLALKVRAAEESLLGALSGSGLSVAALNQADSAKRQDTYVQLEYLAAKDRQAARQSQAQRHDHTNSILAYAVTGGFFLLLIILAFAKPAGLTFEEPVKSILQTMLGVLGTAWVSIITYYFGSSVGSKEKSALLAEDVAASNKPTSAPT